MLGEEVLDAPADLVLLLGDMVVVLCVVPLGYTCKKTVSCWAQHSFLLETPLALGSFPQGRTTGVDTREAEPSSIQTHACGPCKLGRLEGCEDPS